MNIPCKILLATAAMCFSAGGAYAQSAYYATSPFEGIYVGGYAGGVLNPGVTGTLGVVGGANFAVTDGVSVGVEAQGGAAFGNTTTFDALMLAHLGYEMNDEVMVYGALGTGVVNGAGSYAVGGGVEAIVVDQLGVRGEVLGTGAWGGGLSATKATAGLLWHVR
ncbi:hypothetical protein [Mariluticola halotolerans]|uniref:hypothetical protein n=1 Tax=Mariluticola halotolerans TaxID=2909283 RepID=UPI0026E3C17A|nr:hypothetical protein [Mariluticola halotolerans]UJQ94931.1 hypothetical protein L1P08_02785 [Mariluticola halotolerans]